MVTHSDKGELQPELQLGKLLIRIQELNAIGAALSVERDINRLLETILVSAKGITNADAGTLYLLDEDLHVLRFEILRNDTLNMKLGGTSGNPISFWPVQLYIDGQPNTAMVVSHSALSGETVNIPNAYEANEFDFSGTKKFDAKTGYRSESLLAVPMRNHENEIIGVLQLINALDPQTQEVIPFTSDDEKLLESLASQAAIAISNRRLIHQLEGLFESLISLINTAIDEKSPYTGKHCERVPELTMMLAEAATRHSRLPSLANFSLNEHDKYELRIAGLLHDCGKITTPVHVVDKATKLETIFDRIELIETRFEVLKRDAEIALLKGLAAEVATDKHAKLHAEYELEIQQIEDDRTFLRLSNKGSEKMTDIDRERVSHIAQRQWRNGSGARVNFLSADELENLTIPFGTLNDGERKIINNHINQTIAMLKAVPWPRHLKNVTEYAGGHHERVDGKGYPQGLTRDQMSIQARVMAIADIFEALTAHDRPYKTAKTLSESLFILGKMSLVGHVDPDLFDVFIREQVYLEYAKKYLSANQIDEVDISKIPGYTP
jgi:HD-GYP domain-containing protein (c-di-GMP phosphodiesterase class II)